MAITAADLECWGCGNRPDDDTDTAGGAIQDDAHASGGIVMEFTDIAATDAVEVLSDGADTRTVDVWGRNAAGAIVNEIETLDGTTPQTTTQTYERISKVVLSTKDASRTVTVRRATDDATIFTLGPNTLEGWRAFYDAASETGAVTRYKLVYLKNAHGTLSLNSANVQLSSDPEAVLEIALANAKGDVGTITDRTTLPTGIGSWTDDATDVAVPTGALASGERIAVWIRQVLSGGYAAFKNTWQLQLSGTTAP
jgi:hypothetical protein